MIAYGIAWHEGQLFGPVNQAIGVVTVVMLVDWLILPRLPALAHRLGRLRQPAMVG